MRLPRFMRPVWSLAALGLALTLLTAPMAARAADDDDDDSDNGRQGTVRIYGGDADAQGAYLGVQVQDVTRALQRARNLPTSEGALVSRVEDESPADRSGIRRGDVITEVENDKIDSSQDLIRAVRGMEAGTRVRITLWRSGSLRTVNVQLGERPQGMPGMGMPNFRIPSGDDHEMPMPPPQVNDQDVRRQIRELQDQLKELRQEIQSLRREMRRSNDRDDDNDNGRSRGNDDDDDD